MRRLLGFLFVACSSAPMPPPPPMHVSNVPILAHRYDFARTGVNPKETVLRPSNVSHATFGLLHSWQVQGQIYAQPLVAKGMVIVATEHDAVYALDEHDFHAPPIWQTSLGTPMPSSDLDPETGRPYPDIVPEIGITSTPAIDLESSTIFVVAKTKENGEYHNRLHALSLDDGSIRASAEITVPAQLAKHTLVRPAITLSNGLVWIAGGGHGDVGVYSGFVAAFDARTLASLGTYRTVPSGRLGGIWQSGHGLALGDSGEVYFMTGNGTFDDTTDPPNLGDSIGRVSMGAAAPKLDDWFTPHNQAELDTRDDDLGSSGVVTIPDTPFLMGGGKEGKIYLLRRSSMGHITSDDAQVVQSFVATMGHIHGAPVPWNGAIYVWSEYDVMRAFRWNGAMFETQPFMVGTATVPSGMPGGILTISANGTSDGIVWAMHNARDNSDGEAIVEGVVRAFDASDIARELWNSSMDPGDAVGLYAKFCPPVVADGHLYVATFSDALRVYGLR